MTPAETLSVARIAKVNHAGEYGAIRIYGAQIALSRLFWPNLVPMLTELRGHEIEHCALFRAAMTTRSIRPCYTMPVWSIGGALLGGLTALLGQKCIWACTEAVEDTVHHHLSDQLAFLKGRDDALHQLIAAIQTEEEGHLHLAKAQKGKASILTRAVDRIVRLSVHAVVWLSTQGESSRMRRDLAAFSS